MEGKIKKLIRELPRIAGCLQPERVGEMFALTYDKSLKEGSPFDRKDEDMRNAGRRLYCINPMNFQPKNEKAAMIGFARLVIAEHRGYLKKGYITEEQFKILIETLPEAKEKEPEIDNILSYEQALAAEFWWI